MTLNDANEIAGILQSVVDEEILFAMGGRPALINQGILSEYRPIGDLDLNVIIPLGKRLPLSEIHSSFSRIRRCLREHFKDFDVITDVESLKSSAYSEGEEEKDGDDAMWNAIAGLNRESNIDDSFLSSTIAMQAKPPKSFVNLNQKILRQPWNSAIFNWGVSSVISGRRGTGISSPNVIPPMGANIPAEDFFEAPFSTATQYYASPVPMISDDKVRCMVINANIIKLGELILKNSGSIKIDIFPMQTELPTNKIKIINGNVFVAPYVILRAKQKYCRSPKTSAEAFVKHLTDLERSFDAVRIKGINYPEDITLLKDLRTEVLVV